jgi:hypothetical protein
MAVGLRTSKIVDPMGPDSQRVRVLAAASKDPLFFLLNRKGVGFSIQTAGDLSNRLPQAIVVLNQG